MIKNNRLINKYFFLLFISLVAGFIFANDVSAEYWEPWGESVTTNHPWSTDGWFGQPNSTPTVIDGQLHAEIFSSTGDSYRYSYAKWDNSTDPNLPEGPIIKFKINCSPLPVNSTPECFATTYLEIGQIDGNYHKFYVAADCPSSLIESFPYSTYIGDNNGMQQIIDLRSFGITNASQIEFINISMDVKDGLNSSYDLDYLHFSNTSYWEPWEESVTANHPWSIYWGGWEPWNPNPDDRSPPTIINDSLSLDLSGSGTQEYEGTYNYVSWSINDETLGVLPAIPENLTLKVNYTFTGTTSANTQFFRLVIIDQTGNRVFLNFYSDNPGLYPYTNLYSGGTIAHSYVYVGKNNGEAMSLDLSPYNIHNITYMEIGTYMDYDGRIEWTIDYIDFENTIPPEEETAEDSELPKFGNDSDPDVGLDNYTTTNFSAEGNIEDVTNLTLASSSAVIQFPENYSINASGEDYDLNIILGDCFVAVNASALDITFNATAYLIMNNSDGRCGDNTIYEIEGFPASADEIRRGNKECTVCSDIQKTGSFITSFNVLHFSAYAIGSNTRLDIYDEYEGSSVLADTAITFYANYTNYTSGGHIGGADCQIEFDDNPGTTFAMTDNDANYNYTKTDGFSAEALHTWNVTCSNATGGWNTLNVTDDIQVTVAAIPEFSILTLGLGLISVLAGLIIFRRKR